MLRVTTPDDLARLRLAAQGLASPSGSARSVISRLLALQAQDYPAGLQATALRGDGVRAAAVEAALVAGEIVRTWPMRGTLHLIRPDDLAWLLPLCRARARQAAAGRHRQLGLDDGAFDRASDVARDRADGTRVTRAELLGAIRDAGVDTSGQRGAHLIVRLAQDGVIVQATKDVFARYDQTVPLVDLSREEALSRLALRYLAGHGPVTDRDLAWWAGLTLADARAALASVRDQVESAQVDGVTYYSPAGLEPTPEAVWLLPAFDEFLLGYGDRTAQLGAEPLARVVPGLNGMFLSILVVDARVVGTWTRQRRRGVVEVTVHPFGELPRQRLPEVEAAVQHWADVAGVEAELAAEPASL